MWIGSNHGLYYYDLKSETFKSPFKDQAGEKFTDASGLLSIKKINYGLVVWKGCILLT